MRRKTQRHPEVCLGKKKKGVWLVHSTTTVLPLVELWETHTYIHKQYRVKSSLSLETEKENRKLTLLLKEKDKQLRYTVS
jgi:hypothetical protein